MMSKKQMSHAIEVTNMLRIMQASAYKAMMVLIDGRHARASHAKGSRCGESCACAKRKNVTLQKFFSLQCRERLIREIRQIQLLQYAK